MAIAVDAMGGDSPLTVQIEAALQAVSEQGAEVVLVGVKDQIKDSTSQWDDIKAVKVKKYKMKQDIADKGDSDSLWRLGVIAQDLEAAGMDGLVKAETTYQEGDQDTKDHLYTEKDKNTGAIPEGKDVGDIAIAKKGNVGDIKDYKSVKYSILYMKAIKALQEAQTRIETLETKVAALEG